jgi:hypothetical protein
MGDLKNRRELAGRYQGLDLLAPIDLPDDHGEYGQLVVRRVEQHCQLGVQLGRHQFCVSDCIAGQRESKGRHR